MKEIRNFIFDFYGTLVDIQTDENKPELWQKMAEMYSVYGADYSPEELKDAYQTACRQEETLMKKKTGMDLVEIDLSNVFLSLLTKAEKKHKSSYKGSRKEAVFALANMFRLLSRERFGAYPRTISTLQKLKKDGKKIYLLSNAQAVFTLPEMECAGVVPYLDGIYISSEKGMKKPARQFMESLLEEYGLDPLESVMVGNDFYSDIQIAQACNMKSIYLNTFQYSQEKCEACLQEINRDKKKTYRPLMIMDGDIGHLKEINDAELVK